MNYEKNTLQTYTIASNSITTGDLLFFYADGRYDIESDNEVIDTMSLEELQYYASNYVNRMNGSTPFALVCFAYAFSNRDLLFCNTNKLEFAVYGSSNAIGYCNGYKDTYGHIDDLDGIDNYYNADGHNPFSDWLDEEDLYGSYNINLTSQNGYCVFDYSNLRNFNEGDSYTVIRGENMTYYNVATELYFTSAPTNIYFSYGAPNYTMRQESYDNGYGAGYSAGYVQGQQYGYEVGVNSHVDQNTYTAFGYIGQAFSVVSDILAIQVLPHITLGLCFSIPLTFVLIFTIFKLVKK